MFPPNLCVEVLTPEPVTVNLFGNRLFADHQIKMRSLGSTLIPYDSVLINTGSLVTDIHTGRIPCEHQRLPGNYRKLVERHGRVSYSCPSEGTSAAKTLISDFLAYRVVRK